MSRTTRSTSPSAAWSISTWNAGAVNASSSPSRRIRAVPPLRLELATNGMAALLGLLTWRSRRAVRDQYHDRPGTDRDRRLVDERGFLAGDRDVDGRGRG